MFQKLNLIKVNQGESNQIKVDKGGRGVRNSKFQAPSSREHPKRGTGERVEGQGWRMEVETAFIPPYPSISGLKILFTVRLSSSRLHTSKAPPTWACACLATME